jgi:aromatic ring-opening dioxygenase catalytic subunit (LigB family)
MMFPMQDPPIVEVSTMPEKNRQAERWRLAGERLRRLAPDVYASIFAMLVMTATRADRDSSDDITESYFLT